MSPLIHAIPAVVSLTGIEVVLIGGLAVMCRLSRPYRATSDVDIVNHRADDEPQQLQVLRAAAGAEASGPSGVLLPTPAGQVQVDVLEVTDADLATLPSDPTGRLHVMSHAWAAATATPMIIRTQDAPEVSVAIGEPGPLVAMKLQSLMDRGAAKEATDLLDIIRLTLDPGTASDVRSQLRDADPQLRADAALHVTQWFATSIDRSLGVIRKVPDGSGTERDDLQLVSELLLAALAGS